MATGLIQAAALGLQPLSAPTAAGWQAYVAATEAQVARQRGQAMTGLEAVNSGRVLVERVRITGPSGELEVPDAMVMHWRGLILIPGALISRIAAPPAVLYSATSDVVCSSSSSRVSSRIR